MTDPGGNIVRFGQPMEGSPAADRPGSRLERALEAAVLLADSKGDPETAARVIDSALAATTEAPPAQLARARILRADAAHALGDDATATELLAEVARTTLTATDREELADDLARADDLRREPGVQP